jgi:hypothetical protein
VRHVLTIPSVALLLEVVAGVVSWDRSRRGWSLKYRQHISKCTIVQLDNNQNQSCSVIKDRLFKVFIKKLDIA